MTFLGFKIWKVTGHSMFPRIPDYSYVLVCNWLKHLRIKPEQTILVQHRQYGLIIKTVALIDGNGFIWCKGENLSSLAVEQIGPVSRKQVIGRVLSVFKK
ncbi:MAG: nickel-type superoxide dismutase maturation protease [Colwellia sp.]|nr:nickel-type superoxide dismutase maturation protease [Colwellia sp.]